jgi:transposase
MTEIILRNINNVTELVMFQELYKGGERLLNISKLSKELKKDRKTIRKYLQGNVPNKKRKRDKYLDGYREEIKDVLQDKLRSFDYIDHVYRYFVREKGIKCSRSTFNRFIRGDEELNTLFKRKKTNGFIERFETPPGIQGQFDLKERMKMKLKSGEEIKVHVATLTLGFSRYNVRRVVLDTSYETVSSFLAEAFEEIGGVPKELVIDNIKCLVDKPRTKQNEALLNVKFTEFLKDYNIKCKPCMPYRPQTKGKTETQNKVPSQLYNYNGTYENLLDIHDVLEVINREDNVNISQATHLPRIFLLEKEKDDLSPLPPRRIRERYHLQLNEVAVSRESLISYKSKKYSVPKKLIGLKVKVLVKNSRLHIYYNNKIVTVHKITNKIMNIKPEHNLLYQGLRSEPNIILEEMRNINYDDN